MGRSKSKKKASSLDDIPAWLITFSDMMTLMLTFFVLLNSMSVIDEQRKLIALGSIVGTFGMGEQSVDLLSTKNKTTVQPGPLEDVEDLEMLKDLVWDDARQDLRFSENRFVQVLSIASDVLFTPGGQELSDQGRRLLEDILPVLREVDYPLLLAGHTSVLRDELGTEYLTTDLSDQFDPSWRLSLARVLAVYRYLLGRGLPPAMLRVEAFGQYHPFFTSETAEGRRQNRRVDIVLDKRGKLRKTDLEHALTEPGTDTDTYEYRGFVFDVEEKPGQTPNQTPEQAPAQPGTGAP